jgi:hypothetical protein
MIPDRIFIDSASASALGSFSDEVDNYLTRASCQLLCCNHESWGPLSPSQNDFTPCFLSALLLFASVFGLVTGVPTLWWLFPRKHEDVVRKDWQFWTRLVSDKSGSSSQVATSSDPSRLPLLPYLLLRLCKSLWRLISEVLIPGSMI